MSEAIRETRFRRNMTRLVRFLDRRGDAIRVGAALIGALLLLIVVYSTLSPLDLRPILTRDPDIERFLAFMGLAGCFVFAAPQRWLLILTLALLLGGGLEIAQTMRPDRHGLFHDYEWKAAGACLGTALTLTLHHLLRVLVPRI
jgi:hypothetical protein